MPAETMSCASCGGKTTHLHWGGDANIPEDAALCSGCELVETTAWRAAQAALRAKAVSARAAQMIRAAPDAPAKGGSP